MHRCTQGHVLHGTEIPNGPESKAHVNTLQKMKKHSTQCSQTRNGQTMPAPDEERQQGTKGCNAAKHMMTPNTPILLSDVKDAVMCHISVIALLAFF